MFFNLLKRFWPFLILLAGILFPLEWLGEVWPPFGQLMFWVFASNDAHIIGHSVLFSSLGLCLLYLFPVLRRQPWRYYSLILLVAIGQEAFQLLYKRRPLDTDDFNDLLVDLTAATVVLLLVMLWRRLTRKANKA